MKKMQYALFFFAFALLGYFQVAQAEEAEKAQHCVEVSFDFLRKGGTGTTQFAIWVEDSEEKYIKTIFVTSFTTVRGGWRFRNQNLPNWIKTSNVEKMPRKKMDAISGATPGNRRVVKVWDLTDEDGAPVAPGEYTVYLEGTIRRENQVLYRTQIHVGGEGTSIEPVPEYAGTDEKERDMISNVSVVYTP